MKNDKFLSYRYLQILTLVGLETMMQSIFR